MNNTNKAIQSAVVCTKCHNPFQPHHWVFSHGDEHYHSGCLEKTPVKMLEMVEAARKEEHERWAHQTENEHDNRIRYIIFDEMQQWLPEYIEDHYPKGTTDKRGHATVAIVEFLLAFNKHI